MILSLKKIGQTSDLPNILISFSSLVDMSHKVNMWAVLLSVEVILFFEDGNIVKPKTREKLDYYLGTKYCRKTASMA